MKKPRRMLLHMGGARCADQGALDEVLVELREVQVVRHLDGRIARILPARGRKLERLVGVVVGARGRLAGLVEERVEVGLGREVLLIGAAVEEPLPRLGGRGLLLRLLVADDQELVQLRDVPAENDVSVVTFEEYGQDDLLVLSGAGAAN